MIPRNLLTTLFALLSVCTTGFTQYTSPAPWGQRINYIKNKYRTLPTQQLNEMTQYLDSTAIASQCYQFLVNADTTKIVALYLVDKKATIAFPVNREHGGTFRNLAADVPPAGEMELFAYEVTGMLYNGKWYYDVGEYITFNAGNEQEGRDRFLIRILNECEYFKGRKLNENDQFWTKNSFDVNAYIYKDKFPGVPKVVAAAGLEEKKRKDNKDNLQVELEASAVAANIWKELQQHDPAKYHGHYERVKKEVAWLSLYNAERNRALLPIIYYDVNNKWHVLYYVLQFSAEGNKLYRWNKFPEKHINREKGKESLEVVYDMRTFITNWGWYTNMISDEEFWKANFTDRDLEAVALTTTASAKQ